MITAIVSTESMVSSYEVSIIIPVFNEAETLASLIEKIRALRLPRSEIIIVDDGSTDGSADIALNAGASVIRHP